jgi:integrase
MPEKIETTHVILERQLIVYRRNHSGAWQCRYKCDGKWQRGTTKETDLKKAVERAKRLLIEAEIRKEKNLPVVTRKFRDIGKLAIERMNQELASKNGKVSFTDYIRVIEEYLIPFLGNRNVTSIDVSVLDELDAYRIIEMKKVPSKSTMLTHNAALNRVFDEAQMRGFLTDANRPKLESKGKGSTRRPDFSVIEIKALIAGFEGWVERARNKESKEARLLMRDYVMALLDTGARPGVELLDMKWKQIKERSDPIVENTKDLNEEGEVIQKVDMRRSVEMTVSGKTGTRQIVGMNRTVEALRAIATRNYDGLEMPLLTPLINVIKPTNNDYVFRTKTKHDPSSSFQKMFASFLSEHSLLNDPKTEQKRVFYSLRHTYATLALTHDKVPIHTLAKQMGTSVLMIEKHYSHLKVVKAIDQLRGNESRQLIDAGGVIDATYLSPKAVKSKPKYKPASA